MTKPDLTYAKVLVEGGPPTPLDYQIPLALSPLSVGQRVVVPVRGKEKTGVVTALVPTSPYTQVQPILRLADAVTLPADLLALGRWMANYYAATPQSVWRLLCPQAVRTDKEKKQLAVVGLISRPAMAEHCRNIVGKRPAQARILETLAKADKQVLLTELLELAKVSRSAVEALVEEGILRLQAVGMERSPLAQAEYFPTQKKTLTTEQHKALEAISATLSAGTYATHLLQGVTGSGKTEVYLQAIEHALSLNKGVIVLVPEISLTGQTVERLRSRFEGHIALLHHRLSTGERHDEWRRISRGEARICIGPRSAIFSPVPDLGLIIVDEEHEPSYKQSDSMPLYQGRDVAVMRGVLTKATVVLGSATPSLESAYNAHVGKYSLLKLTSRADSARMPKVTIVDMARAKEQSGGHTLFSDALLAALKQRYEVGEQSLLFLNRRGYHAMQWCPKCAEPVKCPECDLSLTFHKRDHQLACHLCGYHTIPPKTCPNCGGAHPMAFKGVGTEQVERAISAILPEARTLRLDADTTRHKGSHERLLQSFRSGKADILIGTQMVAKGLHFPQMTLVGVLNADASLHIPDFRSNERVFQLLTQVAGRAGRASLSGEVIIQTWMPEHPTIRLAATQDYEAFYQSEMQSRETFAFPPFSHLVKVSLSGEDEPVVQSLLEELHNRLIPHLPPNAQVLPVTPSGYAKIKGKYRYQFLAKGASASAITRPIQALVAKFKLPKSCRIAVDVDPISTYF